MVISSSVRSAFLKRIIRHEEPRQASSLRPLWWIDKTVSRQLSGWSRLGKALHRHEEMVSTKNVLYRTASDVLAQSSVD